MGEITELHLKYRPKSLKYIVGQPEAVAVVEGWVKDDKIPHVILLAGPTGVGKTTIARILKSKLECSDTDFEEINAADTRGIDTVRAIRQRVGLKPWGGKSRIWLIDESHKLTGDAQSALLTPTENFPLHAYFIFCTTDPEKMITTLRGRCTRVDLKHVDEVSLQNLLWEVADKEKVELSEELVEAVVKAAEGSARNALSILGSCLSVQDNDERLALVVSPTTQKQAIDICKALMNPRASWADVAAMLKEVKEEPEKIRRAVLGYCRGVLLGGGKLAPYAFQCIQIFRSHYFDVGAAGLAADCYEAKVACKK